MSKEVNALTIELFHDIVKNHHDTYWRYYLMFYNDCHLADKNPKKFIKQESESGLAMWDDPPKGWSERDLYIWSKGYIQGRCVETGNISGIMRNLELLAGRLMNKDYGFRDGVPTKEQVSIHAGGSILGFWILKIDNTKDNDIVTVLPMLYCLRTEKNKMQYFDDRWKNLTKRVTNKIISSMPVTMGGIPIAWDSLKRKKKKNG